MAYLPTSNHQNQAFIWYIYNRPMGWLWDICKPPHPLGGSSYFCYAFHNQSLFFVHFLFDGTPSISWPKFLWLKKMEVIRSSFYTTPLTAVAHPSESPDLAAGKLVRSDLKYHRVPHRSGLGRVDGFAAEGFFFARQTNFAHRRREVFCFFST